MVELPQRHLRPDVLAHRDDRETERGHGLMRVALLLGVNVLRAHVQHALDLEHVARAGERARLNEDEGRLGERVLDRLERLDRRVGRVLPTEVEKREGEGHEPAPLVAQLLVLALHHRLQDRHRHLGVARAGEDEAERERGDRGDLHRDGRVPDGRQEELADILARRARVGDADADRRAHAQRHALGADVIRQQRERRIHLRPHARVHDAVGEQCSSLPSQRGST